MVIVEKIVNFIYIHFIHICMTEETNNRLVFRATEIQYKRLNQLLINASQYKTMSELLRHIVEIGLKQLEGGNDGRDKGTKK